MRISLASVLLLVAAGSIIAFCSPACPLGALWGEAAAASGKPPRAVQGRLDASSWDFARGSLPLSGEWELYFGQLLEPGDFPLEGRGVEGTAVPPELPPGEPLYAPVPGSWRSVPTEEGSLPRYGAATYRLLITGLPEPDSAPWALRIPYARTAYRLWVDDRLVASNGAVSLRPEQMEPHYQPTIAPLPSVPAPARRPSGNGSAVHPTASLPAREDGRGTPAAAGGSPSPPAPPVQIVMQVSNGHFRDGGIPKNLVLGPLDQVIREYQRRLTFQMFLTGALALMALYFALAYFLWQRKNPPILYFALLSGSVAVRSFFTGELPFSVYIPDLPWSVLLRIEYVTSYVAPLIFVLFLHALFPRDVSRTVRNVWMAVGLTGTVASLLLPVRYSSLVIPYYTVLVAALIVYVCCVLVQAARRKREGAEFTLVGGLLFVIAVVLTIFHYNQVWIDFDWVPSGLFPLLLFQAFALNRRAALAFRQATDLARQNGLLLEEARRRMSERNRLYRLLVQQDEQTRRRIAELLHGRVQSRLFSASQSAAQAAAAVERDAREAIRLMHYVHDTVEEVRKREIREASHRLHPAAIRAGLVGALESLCSGRHHELAVEFSVDPALTFLDDPGGLRLAENVRLGFYRIVEEALNNVESHAHASRDLMDRGGLFARLARRQLI